MTDRSTLDAILECREAFPGELQQDPHDAASADAEWQRKFGEQPPRIRDARDFLIHVGDSLAAIGLEPDVRAGALALSLVDLDCDVEETLRGQGDRDLLAAGLPVG